MAESLLENYNPLYDVHLRQYFALPHMQKHLRRMGLLDSNGVPVAQNGNVESELYARHHAMMDMMLRNRERVLMQLAELQKKYDAAEKVEVYRRVRSGATNPDEFARNHLSRSLSRPRRAATQPPKSGSGRRRHSSNSFEDTEVINRIEKTYEQPNQVVINPKSTYDRLAANAFKYQFLHKLDDSTLSNYKESLAKQLQKLQRFRDISFGPHSVARHQPSLQTSWFFRRRSLPSLTPHSNSQHDPLRSLKSVKNGTANSAEPHRRHGKSQSPRRHANVTHHQRRKSPQKAISSAPHRLPPISTAASKPKSPPASQPSKPVGIVAGVAAAGAAIAASVGAVLNGSDEKASEKGTPPKSTTPEPIEASSPVPVRQLSESPPPVPTPPPIHPAEEHMDTESDAEEAHRDKRSVSFDHESEQHTDHEDNFERQSDAGATESEVSVPATPPGDHEIHAAMTQSMYQGVPEDFNEKHVSLDSLNEQPSETHEDEEEPVTPHGDAPASQGHDSHHDDVEERQSEVHVSVEAASPREEQHFEEFYERPYSTEVKHENYDIQESEAKPEEEHYDAPASPHQSEPEDTLTAPDVPEGLPEDREPSPETDNPIEDKSVPIVEDASELRRYSEHSPVIEITEAEPLVLTDDEEEHHDHHDGAEEAPKPASNEVSPPQASTEQVSEHDPVNSDDEERIEQVHHEPATAAPDSESIHHDDQSVHSEHGHDSEHEHPASPVAESVHSQAAAPAPEHVDHSDAGSEHHETESHHDAESVHNELASARSVTSVHHDDAASEHHSEHPHDDAESVHSVSASVRSLASSHHDAAPEHDDHHDDAASEQHSEHHDNVSVHSETASARSVRSVHDDAASEHHSEHHDAESHHDVESVHGTPASARSLTSVHHDDGASEHHSEHPHDDAGSVHSVSASVRSIASSHHDAASVHHDDVADHDDHHSEHESGHHETEHHEEHPDNVSVHHSETGSVHNVADASPRSVASAHHDEPASEHGEHNDDVASEHHSEHADHHDAESVHSVSASVRSLASSHHGEAASEHPSDHHDAESVHGTPASARSVTSVHHDDAASEHHSEHSNVDAASVHSVSASVRSLASSHHDAPSEHHDAESVHHDDAADHDDHHSEHESVHHDDSASVHSKPADTESIHSHSEVHSVRSRHPSEHGSVQDVHHDVDDHSEPTHVEHVIEPREVTTSHSTHTTVIHETSYSSRDGTTNSVRHDTYEVRGNDDGSADVHHETIESTDGAPAEVKKEDYTVDGGAIIEGHVSPVASEHGSQASHAVSDGHRAGSPAASEHSIVHSDAESQKGGVDPMNQSIYVTSEDHHDGADVDPHDQFHEEIVEQATARSIDSFEKHEAELSEPRQSIPNYLESPNIQITAPSDAGDLDHVNDNISAASTPISPAGNKTFPGEPETHEEHHSETVTTTDDNGTKTTTTTTTTSYQSMVISHDNNGNDNESDVEDEEHANLLGNGNGHDAEAEDSGSDAGGTSSVVHHKTVAGESTTYHFTRSDDELSETGAGQL